MIKFLNKTFNTILDSTINDLYGSEEKPNKPAIYVGIFFSVIFTVLLIVLFSCENTNNGLEVCLVYFAYLSFSLLSFAFSSYFFQKKKNMNKFKRWKSFAFILSIIFILIALFPITLLSIVSEKIKFTTFLKYMDIYFITMFIPLIISVLVIPNVLLFAFNHCIYLSTLNLNYATILALLIFLIYQVITSLFLFAFHKIGKHKLNDKVYKSIKKDFNVLVYAEITTITVIANCFVFSDIEQELVKGFTSAFTIYIAFDRLVSKWKTLNKQFEQDSKQDTP